jgi:hypothetical protein
MRPHAWKPALLVLLALLAASPPAGAIRQFIVFFSDSPSGQLDPVQWHVGPEGEAVIREAAYVQRQYGARILLTAGDQRLGSLEDSIERARKRADAVRELLVKHGVERAKIFTKPCGYIHFIIDTPPETKEPQNRFVIFNHVGNEVVLTDGSREGCENQS